MGAAEVDEDEGSFEAKIERLTSMLEKQFIESAKLEKVIRSNFRKLGYE